MVDGAVAVAGSVQQPQHSAGQEPRAVVVDSDVAVSGSVQQPQLTVHLTSRRTGAWSSGG